MGKLLVLFALIALGGFMAISTPEVSASPVSVTTGTDCVLQDAAEPPHTYGGCVYRRVTKTVDGEQVLVSYEDKGRLPEDAVLPSKTITGTVEQDGIVYKYVITPSGQYSSRGPF